MWKGSLKNMWPINVQKYSPFLVIKYIQAKITFSSPTNSPKLNTLSISGGRCNAGDLGSVPASGRSLQKQTATHSSILAWRIPWTKAPGGLQPTGSQRVRHDWVTNSHSILRPLQVFWKQSSSTSLQQQQSKRALYYSPQGIETIDWILK